MVERLKKLMARYPGMVIVEKPPKNLPNLDMVKDYVMAFHYCKGCNDYRHDRHYELMSLSERFYCGGCGTERSTRCFGPGVLIFTFKECARLARKNNKNKGFLYTKLLFWKYFLLGLGKDMPESREGLTTGELEFNATMEFVFLMFSIINMR